MHGIYTKSEMCSFNTNLYTLHLTSGRGDEKCIANVADGWLDGCRRRIWHETMSLRRQMVSIWSPNPRGVPVRAESEYMGFEFFALVWGTFYMSSVTYIINMYSTIFGKYGKAGIIA